MACKVRPKLIVDENLVFYNLNFTNVITMNMHHMRQFCSALKFPIWFWVQLHCCFPSYFFFTKLLLSFLRRWNVYLDRNTDMTQIVRMALIMYRCDRTWVFDRQTEGVDFVVASNAACSNERVELNLLWVLLNYCNAIPWSQSLCLLRFCIL